MPKLKPIRKYLKIDQKAIDIQQQEQKFNI